MTVLVTGGAGYIGSHMVHHLIDGGENVVVLDNLSTGFDWVVPKRAVLIIGDTGDQALVARIIREHGVDAVIHFAASIVVPDSVRNPLAYYHNNTMNSRSLIECAVKSQVRHFIFSSTAAVYGDPVEVPVSESAQTEPISPYGWSKLMTELILRDVGQAHDLQYVILRYFNVAGADPQGRTGQSTKQATHLIKVAVEAALGTRDKLEIYGNDYPNADGTCIRDYIHVSDLVSAHAEAVRYLRSGAPSLTLNCGYGRGYSVLEVIEAVKRVSGRDFPVVIGPRRPGDPSRIVARSERIRAKLGWHPRYADLSDIVNHALAWERVLRARSKSIDAS